MRSRHKSWQDGRLFSRRVIWYQDTGGPTDIRLKFWDEPTGVHSHFYKDRAAAQRDYDAFRAGTLTVTMIRTRTLSSRKS